MSKNPDQVFEDIANKVVAAQSFRMIAHMELETQLPQYIIPRIIGVFQPYWRNDITFGQLMEALRLIGYGADLDTDGFLEFIDKGDLH